jgi:ribosomal protein L19
VRRSRLYYLSEKVGKAARIKERKQERKTAK